MTNNLMNQKRIKQLEKYLYRLIIVTFLIILVSSLESFILAKSSELSNLYRSLNPGSSESEYINAVLVNFLLSIFEPSLLTLFTFFTYKRFGITKIYKFVFSIILGLRLFNLILSARVNSIFYYILILLYVILIIVVIKAPVNKRKD